MHGARRVAVFCLLTAVLPTILLIIPLYLRHSVFMDVVYSVAESDVLEIVEGISTIFCQVCFLIFEIIEFQQNNQPHCTDIINTQSGCQGETENCQGISLSQGNQEKVRKLD